MDTTKMLQALSVAVSYLSQDQVLLATGFVAGATNSATMKQCLEEPHSSLLSATVTGTISAGVIFLISRLCPKSMRAVFPVILLASMIYCKLNRKTIKVSTSFSVAE